MGKIQMEDMEFFAFHGCYAEEKVVGNKFRVQLTLETDMEKPAVSDNIKDALNYQAVYHVVKEEMEITSNLLENVSKRILNHLFDSFPQLKSAKIKVSKMNPPIGGKMKCVSVVLER
jgi:7,8-dihydroneopterin aldolase/epimerase/oxygenase